MYLAEEAQSGTTRTDLVSLTCIKNTTMQNFIFFLATTFLPYFLAAQIRWDGGGGNDMWNNANNWAPDGVPSASDDIILDNALITGSYSVQLPSGAIQISVNTIHITPSGSNSITLQIPSSNNSDPGLHVTGASDALLIDNGGVLKNSSGATTGNGIVIDHLLRINNGGKYIHNTTRGNANLINQLSTDAGTELGIFEFDVPGTAGYTLSLTGNNFGSLAFSAAASGGTRSYSGGGASPLTIRGNLKINAGASVTSTMTANIFVAGNLEVNGNLNMNPVTAGVTNRSLIFNGNTLQSVSGSGNIIHGPNFRNIEVGDGSTLLLQRNIAIANAGNKFQVNANGKLLTGMHIIDGNGSFVLAPNGYLAIGSAEGITLNSNVGNIQTSVRNFSSDGNYEYNGPGDQYSGNGLPANVNMLVVNKGSGDLIMTTNAKITGAFELKKGRTITSENSLIVITSATSLLSPANNYGNTNEGWEESFVSGPILLENNSTGTISIPIGKNNRFAPIRLRKANLNPATFTLEYFPFSHTDVLNFANPPLDHISGLEYWEIHTNANNTDDDDAQLSFSWGPGSAVGTSDAERADLCIAHYENRGNGLRWEKEGLIPFIAGNLNYGFITTDNNVAEFSAFTLSSASKNNVLPWKLISFEAMPGKDKIDVYWEISDDSEILHYDVERSSDGQIFQQLDTIPPEHRKINTRYSFSDLKPLNGWNYYRIGITDEKNRTEYSYIAKIYYEPVILRIYPNPVQSSLQIFLSGPRSRYNLDIVNTNGRVVKRYHSLSAGVLRIDNLQKGIYFVRVYNENETVTRSFLKL